MRTRQMFLKDDGRPGRRGRVPAFVAAVLSCGLGVSAAHAQVTPREVPLPTPVDSVGLPVSPAGAFVRSLVIPGWGQAYVGAPGRGAVYFALEAGSAWMTYKTWRQLEEGRALQARLRRAGRLEETEKLDIVESREEQFEDWMTLSVFFVLFSGLDAFVTAQLADFDEHIGVLPTNTGLTVEARVPTGGAR